MRKLLALLLIAAGGYANAQVSISGQAGWNSNFIHRSDNYNYDGGYNGWQAGLQVVYTLKHWFIYSGAQLDKNVFYTTFYYPSGPAVYTYHPLYITVPLGAGYQFGLGKQLAIRLYAGVYGSEGISGKLKISSVICGDFTVCPENPPSQIRTENIKYGNTVNDDITKTNAGLQFGAGVLAWKKFELSFMYNAGLANIHPYDSYNNTKLKLNTIALNAKYNLVTSGNK